MFFNELPDFVQLVRRGRSFRESVQDQRRRGSPKGPLEQVARGAAASGVMPAIIYDTFRRCQYEGLRMSCHRLALATTSRRLHAGGGCVLR